MVLAASGSREIVLAFRESARVQKSSQILNALASNPNVSASEGSAIQQIAQTGFEEISPIVEPANPPAERTAAAPDEVDVIYNAFVAEHAIELEHQEGKPFQPIGGLHGLASEAQDTAEAAELPAPVGSAVAPSSAESLPSLTHSEAVLTPVSEPSSASAPIVTGSSAAAAAAALKKSPKKKDHPTPEAERGSALQKISNLDIKGRIQLAMKGTKEERSILVRDGTKLVALAVLESPKISDGEVEKFASQKNVLEAVLRQITMKRRFMKNYAVVRNLVYNPRTPIDLSLGLMKNLLVTDLRNLASNKEVSDTIRKLALKMFKQKTDTRKKSTD
jgi:hypothetical protein